MNVKITWNNESRILKNIRLIQKVKRLRQFKTDIYVYPYDAEKIVGTPHCFNSKEITISYKSKISNDYKLFQGI